MKRVQILLSTYNGEKFLRQQLDSFTALDNFLEIKVLIRDDGSSDGTLCILDEYSEKYGFEVIKGENIGLNRSIHELMKRRDCTCEFYSFSDQDDVWLPCKVSRGVRSLEVFGDSPALYAACSSLTDIDLNVTGHLNRPARGLSFYNAMIENVGAGHTMIMNRALMDMLVCAYGDGVLIFDHFFYMYASAVGDVVYDDECTTLYRQHGTNAIGYSSGFFSRMKMQIRAISHDLPMKVTKQIMFFKESLSDTLPIEYRNELDRFINKERNFFTRLSYVFSSKMYRQSRMESFVLRMMYLFGMYKTKRLKKLEKGRK